MTNYTRESGLNNPRKYLSHFCGPTSFVQALSRSGAFMAAIFFAVTLLSGASAMAASKSNEKGEGGDKAPPAAVHKKSLAKRVKASGQSIHAKAFYCVDPLTNRIILERNADEQLPVASLTKLVTAMVILEHLPLDTKVRVPDHIKTVPKTVIGLKPGDRLSVEDLLHGLLIGSGNDCAETLACAFPGGKEKLVKAMNKKVRSLGFTHTKFYTPSGLDKKTGAEHSAKQAENVECNVSTAKEMAQIARVAFTNTIIRMISVKKGYVLKGENGHSYPVRTTNKLLRDDLPVYGAKTGFTSRAGHCLASEFRRGKSALLIVVLGSPNHFRDTKVAYRIALKKSEATKPDPQPDRSSRTAAFR
ncbi:MAG: D-alanyl-D-alanine carboxypeptidase family protein [Desulfomonilaceae bacterium]